MSSHAPTSEHAHPPNRLIHETSPYLLQHARNPVDWHPWGPEALASAKAEDKPIFLSIGYSACHWCHVMERESFENADIAELMNQWFVNIKVDREERPDLDQIYMAAVQAMNQGHGGWPMSVFLTPDGEPFFGGTYYPPRDSRGMPGFPRVLDGVHRAWVERRADVRDAASQLVEMLQDSNAAPAQRSDAEFGLDGKWIDRAANQLARMFDPIHGGFGNAPKFPHPMDLKVLLRHYARSGNSHSLHMVTHTIDKMARGGIYDHLGGGFARYSTDARWLVPHFEKMLYDNALLVGVCLELHQASGHADVAQVAAHVIDYVLSRMTSPQGGFYSTEDADSEGEEGKYYVWTKAEIFEILGPERGAAFAYAYDVNEEGNWEGVVILNQPKTYAQAAKMLGRDEAELRAELAESRSSLLAARDRRTPPGKDEKVLTSWNGLMLGPLAEAAWVLDQPRYLDAARKAAGFLLDVMVRPDGLLLRCWKDGQAKLNGYLDDYANLIDGLTRLFEATGEFRWIEAAVKLAEVMIREFTDSESGGFYYTGASHETLVARPKETHDNATPSGSAVAALALLRLGALTGRTDLNESGQAALRSLLPLLAQLPAAAGQTAVALDFALQPPQEFAVCAGADPEEFRQGMRRIHGKLHSHKVVAPIPPGSAPSPDLIRLVPLLQNRQTREGRLTTYICRDFTCAAPVIGVEALEKVIS